jgi:23S rRNA (adenine2503-C2)-methyltransferase
MFPFAVNDASLLSVLPEDLLARFPDLEPPEARRLLSVIHRTGKVPPHAPAGVRRDPFQRIRDSVPLLTLEPVTRRPSALDPFVKYAFRTADDRVVEAVRIPLERPGRFVVCVSSQTGCSLGCAFCATARLGAGRNLAAWEIVDQVRQVRDDLPVPGRVHGVVFQGMGEPLANVDTVIQAVRVMTDPSLQSIDGRAITVSTAGLLKPLPRLFETLPRVRIGVSIGHADPEKRRALMPVEGANPLRQVLDIAADHARSTRIATMLSYTLLRDVNDGEQDAEAFLPLLDRYVKRAGLAPRVSLIPYNPIGPSDPFLPSEPDQAEKFRMRLSTMAVPVVRRYSGGADVGAACGQLGMEWGKG